MTGRRGQEGQVLVMSALVMAFLFLPLSVFVIDTALVDSAYLSAAEHRAVRPAEIEGAGVGA